MKKVVWLLATFLCCVSGDLVHPGRKATEQYSPVYPTPEPTEGIVY